MGLLPLAPSQRQEHQLNSMLPDGGAHELPDTDEECQSSAELIDPARALV